MTESNTKKYLGDSVYVNQTYFGIVITTENEYTASNTIYMDSTVWALLKEYVEGFEVKSDES